MLSPRFGCVGFLRVSSANTASSAVKKQRPVAVRHTMRLCPRSSGSTPYYLRGYVFEVRSQLPRRQIGSRAGCRCVSAVVPPAARNNSVTFCFFDILAISSGVSPSTVLALTSAPNSNSIAAAFNRSCRAAQCRGVVPAPYRLSRVLGSASFSNMNRSVSFFPSLAS